MPPTPHSTPVRKPKSPLRLSLVARSQPHTPSPLALSASLKSLLAMTSVVPPSAQPAEPPIPHHCAQHTPAPTPESRPIPMGPCYHHETLLLGALAGT